MQTIQFQVEDEFPVEPSVIYNAWLSTDEHTAMTGAGADVSDTVGQTFTAWDGYITGKNIECVPNKKIVQQWRTSDFSDDEDDSLLEVTFESSNNGTVVTITHSNLPPHGTQYEQGWKDSYFTPMKDFFSNQ
jgi:activator of HSP90 ATPase